MSANQISPTGKELFFPENELIVSKTDLKGKITYANALFERMSGYSHDELLGQPHNIIRHPDMPRCIFELFWATLQQQKEIFAFVVNLHRSGDHYWVLAHVVPSYNLQGNHIGYHSSRRCPKKPAVREMGDLYKKLLEIEKSHPSPRQGIKASHDCLMDFLDQKGASYAEYIFALSNAA